MKRKIMLSLEDIRNNLRVYIVGEKDLWLKQNNYDDPKHYIEEELGIQIKKGRIFKVITIINTTNIIKSSNDKRDVNI